VKQYQIDVHPDKLRAHRVTLMDVYEAVRQEQHRRGREGLEKNGVEFFIRGVGFIKSVEDLERVVIRQEGGTPIPQTRRDRATRPGLPPRRAGQGRRRGRGRRGADALRRKPAEVVERVKDKITQLEPGLPQKTLADGRVSKVKIVPFYDRTDIVKETIDTLKEALRGGADGELVIFIFLLHLRSTATVLITLPLSVWLCFILMYAFGVDSNIMSLAGLAIAIGDVADMGIIMTENIYRHIATRRGEAREEPFRDWSLTARPRSAARLSPPSRTPSFPSSPSSSSPARKGKLFRPLAFTKTFAIGGPSSSRSPSCPSCATCSSAR
jgi:Cu(I)/Ag(I) efflux system membrane protein CusA/SilA